ncbi:MAG: Glyoxalase/bleomycin resistance protein/dioxygenase [Paenibacillus sp.]|nr:Glyoxalase/bleomycin resistance protein/dioxygenase [Paenibacillus sp.]
MIIQRVKLLTHQLASLKYFYTGVLGMPLIREQAGTFTVRAGRSLLQFEERLSIEPYYHFAMAISENQLDSAEAWLAARHIDMYRFADGKHQLYSVNWHATSLYFHDPAGNIVEFIAHHSLANVSEGDFTIEQIRSLCEIGLPVEDVPRMSAFLNGSYGFGTYKNSDSQFAPLGDMEGLFILSKVKRIWLGSHQQAAVFPVEIDIKNGRIHEDSLGGYPYSIKSV